MDEITRLKFIANGLRQVQDVLVSFMEREGSVEAIARAAAAIVKCYRGDGRVLCCGNGGSMCDAIHFAEEFTGRFRRDRRALSAIALCDPGHLTCVANDFGYDQVFARGVEAHGRPGDVLVAISTSGTSANVMEAVRMAKTRGLTAISLTGRPNSALAAITDLDICVHFGDSADRTQEVHIVVLHHIVELVERELFPENYAMK